MDQVIRAQKMESVGMIAAGMAHDFNNVLSIILPNAQMIQLRTPQDLAVRNTLKSSSPHPTAPANLRGSCCHWRAKRQLR
jgi:hypothetical protein